MYLRSILVALMISNTLFAENNKIETWTKSYNEYLKKYVHSGEINGVETNSVDYFGLRNTQFKSLKIELQKIKNIDKLSKSAKLAFWINVYNYLTVYKVVNKPEIKKLTDLNTIFTNVWKQDAGIVAGKMRTLDEIEHQILRKMGEPRIHFSIVCASVSCPDLRTEAFREDILESQLADQFSQFAKNAKKGIKVDKKNKIIYISKIFSWFGGDFKPTPVKWLIKQNIIKQINNEYDVEYFSYDWNLNGKN